LEVLDSQSPGGAKAARQGGVGNPAIHRPSHRSGPLVTLMKQAERPGGDDADTPTYLHTVPRIGHAMHRCAGTHGKSRAIARATPLRP